MNYKTGLSIALAALGLLLIVNGFWSMGHVSAAQKEVQKLADSKNPILRTIGEETEELFGTHRSRIRWSFIGGIAFVLLGSGGLYYFRKR
jgi:uncharacterized protein YjeT (DUF2065 family)